MSFQVREWVLDAPITAAKVDGGPEGDEIVILGLASGVVLQVFVNNAFPVELVKAAAPVVCCAMSLHRKKVNHRALVQGAPNGIFMTMRSQAFQDSVLSFVKKNQS